MDTSARVTAILIGLAYATWPNVGRYVGVTGEWVAVIVILGTALPMVVLSGPDAFMQPVPPLIACAALFVSSLINGLAQNMHSWKSADPSVKIGIFSMLVYVAMVVGAPLLDRVLNGTQLSNYQIAAVLLSFVVVYLAGR